MLPKNINQQSSNRSTKLLEGLLLIICTLTSILIIIWLFIYANYGIDFTDEGFYLNFISNPFLYSTSLTQFGFIYNPIYVFLNGEIASLRQFNILIIFLLSWYLTNLLLQQKFIDNNLYDRLASLVISFGFSTSSLITFISGLTTPSYNSLTLQSLLIFCIGWIFVYEAVNNNKKILGCILIGLGGYLAFMAKPSTAFGLTIVVFTYFIITFNFPFKRILIAFITTLILIYLSAFLIDGSFLEFTKRIERGIEAAKLLGGGHTVKNITRWDDFQLNNFEKNIIKIGSILLLFLTILVYFDKKKYIYIGFILITLISYIFFYSTEKIPTDFGAFRALIIGIVVFPMGLMSFFILRQKIIYSLGEEKWAMALLFLTIPYIYAFGTNNNYWRASGDAAIFWVLMGIIFLRPLAKKKQGWIFTLPLVLTTQILSVVLLQTGLENPYRQLQPLRLNQTVISIGVEKSKLVLSEEYAKYLESAMQGSSKAGLEAGMPVIDMTGQSPTILYAIGAESIGQAWTIGGYPGSQKLAEAALARVPCEKLSSAWLLVEDGGPRSLSSDLLATYGATLFSDFQVAAFWWTAQGAGGYKSARYQVLYKPTQSELVLNNCHSLRNAKRY